MLGPERPRCHVMQLLIFDDLPPSDTMTSKLRSEHPRPQQVGSDSRQGQLSPIRAVSDDTSVIHTMCVC